MAELVGLNSSWEREREREGWERMEGMKKKNRKNFGNGESKWQGKKN